jgi:hypothetical protein
VEGVIVVITECKWFKNGSEDTEAKTKVGIEK